MTEDIPSCLLPVLHSWRRNKCLRSYSSLFFVLISKNAFTFFFYFYFTLITDYVLESEMLNLNTVSHLKFLWESSNPYITRIFEGKIGMKIRIRFVEYLKIHPSSRSSRLQERKFAACTYFTWKY